MTEKVEYIISPWEAESYVENLQISEMENIGTKGWFEFHKRLILLNQQCVLEINALREETIKEWFITFKKLPVLIYEAILIDVWKHKIFPYLLEINGEPKNTFMLFSVFYHEDIAVSLLENVLFHSESIETMDDTVLDLVDYAVKYTSLLLDVNEREIYETVGDPNSCLQEVLEKKKEIEFDIGIRCISILRYLAEFLDRMPLYVVSRMLSTFDVPYLLVQLIETHPWRKENSEGESVIYNGGWKKMKSNEEERISKVEGQVWFGLRELLLNPKCGPYYEITEHRLTQLLKLQKYLHETVLDQIAPLIDLKRWLSYINISSPYSKAPGTVNVEIMPQGSSDGDHDFLYAELLPKYEGHLCFFKWKAMFLCLPSDSGCCGEYSAVYISKELEFLTTSHCIRLNNRYQTVSDDGECIKSTAQILSNAYDLDKLDCIDVKECFLCNEQARKRCSKCKEAWYCGRECQIRDWINHKPICDKISNNKSEQKD